MNARDAVELSAYLRQLAENALDLEYATTGYPVISDKLRELADRQLVALPHINPQHDQLDHWTRLSDHRLQSEIHADAWNLAAGIVVQRDRAAMRNLQRGAS